MIGPNLERRILELERAIFRAGVRANQHEQVTLPTLEQRSFAQWASPTLWGPGGGTLTVTCYTTNGSGYSGISVDLYDATVTLIQTVVTGGDGTAAFGTVAAGTYSVHGTWALATFAVGVVVAEGADAVVELPLLDSTAANIKLSDPNGNVTMVGAPGGGTAGWTGTQAGVGTGGGTGRWFASFPSIVNGAAAGAGAVKLLNGTTFGGTFVGSWPLSATSYAGGLSASAVFPGGVVSGWTSDTTVTISQP